MGHKEQKDHAILLLFIYIKYSHAARQSNFVSSLYIESHLQE